MWGLDEMERLVPECFRLFDTCAPKEGFRLVVSGLMALARVAPPPDVIF
jgi:hypothetical protein